MPEEKVKEYAEETEKLMSYVDEHMEGYRKIAAQEGIFSLPVGGNVYSRDEGPIMGYDPEEERVYYYDVEYGVRQNTLGSRNTFNSKPWKVISVFGLEAVLANMKASADRAASDLLS